MAGKTPKEAVDNFLSPIQLVLSCFTKSVIYHGGGSYKLGGGPYAAMVAKEGKFSLPGVSLWLSVSMQYKIVEADEDRGPYKVKMTSYRYGIEDKRGKEILSYDWHPNTGMLSPHLHLHVPTSIPPIIDFHKKHLPTGRVSIEQILRLTVEEFGVRPIRKDWGKILSDAQGQFEKWRTWHYCPKP